MNLSIMAMSQTVSRILVDNWDKDTLSIRVTSDGLPADGNIISYDTCLLTIDVIDMDFN